MKQLIATCIVSTLIGMPLAAYAQSGAATGAAAGASGRPRNGKSPARAAIAISRSSE